jgi:hypothetical protein
VLNQLADAHGVGFFGNGGHAQAEHAGDEDGKQFLHNGVPPKKECIIKAAPHLESRLDDP